MTQNNEMFLQAIYELVAWNSNAIQSILMSWGNDNSQNQAYREYTITLQKKLAKIHSFSNITKPDKPSDTLDKPSDTLDKPSDTLPILPISNLTDIVRQTQEAYNNQDHIFKHDIWQRYLTFEGSNSVKKRKQNLKKQINLSEQKIEQNENTEENSKKVRWLKFQLRYIQSQVFRDFLKQDEEYKGMTKPQQHHIMNLFVEHFSTMEGKKMLFDLDMIQNSTRKNKEGNWIEIPKFELEDKTVNAYSVRELLKDRRAKWKRLQESDDWNQFQNQDPKKPMDSDAKKKIEEELKIIFWTPPCWLSVYGPMCGFDRVKAAWRKAIKSDPQDNWENHEYYLDHTNVDGSTKHYIIGNKMSSYSDTINSYHLEFD